GGGGEEGGGVADGKFRHRPDPDQAGLVLLIAIEVAARERFEGGPPLAAGRNELTLVLTDRARRRRRVRGRKLAATGFADEGGHHTTRHVDPMCFVLQRAARRNAPCSGLRWGGGPAGGGSAWNANGSAASSCEPRARPTAKIVRGRSADRV